MILLILILLVWSILRKKLKHLLTIKTLQLTFLEYKHTIQYDIIRYDKAFNFFDKKSTGNGVNIPLEFN